MLLVNALRILPRPLAGQRLEDAGQQLESWKAPWAGSWRWLGAWLAASSGAHVVSSLVRNLVISLMLWLSPLLMRLLTRFWMRPLTRLLTILPTTPSHQGWPKLPGGGAPQIFANYTEIGSPKNRMWLVLGRRGSIWGLETAIQIDPET